MKTRDRSPLPDTVDELRALYNHVDGAKQARIRKKINRLDEALLKPPPLTKEEKSVLASIEDSAPTPRGFKSKRSRGRLSTGVDESGERVVRPRAKGYGVCAVSGCGNDLSALLTRKGKPALICASCWRYGASKVTAQRSVEGRAGVIYLGQVLAALGVQFEMRRLPTTGRHAAYRHGHGGSYSFGMERKGG